MNKRVWFLGFLYVAVIVGANITINSLGAWATPYVAFVAIGFDFTVRDYIHDQLTSRKELIMGALIIVAGVLTYAVNAEALWIALGSSLAFMTANAADFMIYEKLLDKKYLLKSNASNVVSTAVDSFVFIAVAFGLSWELAFIAGFQFLMKVAGGGFWSFFINKLR